MAGDGLPIVINTGLSPQTPDSLLSSSPPTHNQKRVAKIHLEDIVLSDPKRRTYFSSRAHFVNLSVVRHSLFSFLFCSLSLRSFRHSLAKSNRYTRNQESLFSSPFYLVEIPVTSPFFNHRSHVQALV